MSYYIHHTPGRLRIRTPVLRRQKERAREAEELLTSLEGVRQVRIRPLTGSLVVLYREEQVSPERLTAVLVTRGFLPLPEATDAWFRATLIAHPLMRQWEAAVEKILVSVARYALKQSFEKAVLKLF